MSKNLINVRYFPKMLFFFNIFPHIKKFVTTPQMAERLLQKLRQRYVCTASNNISTAESVMRSLELVRIAVQASFDMEIDALIRKFIEVIIYLK